MTKKIKVIASRVAHIIINPIAWKLYPNEVTKENWLWRLNDWVARPSVDDYIYRKTGRTREEWSKRLKRY